MFNRQKKLDRDIVAAVADELNDTAFLAPTMPVAGDIVVQISEYHAGKLSELIAYNRGQETELAAQLADVTERLRQTRLVIASLEPAQAKLAKDIKP